MNRSIRDSLITWVDDRFEEILRAPNMWGSREAVEVQVLLLSELKTFVRHPTFNTENPRYVCDTYMIYLRDRFPNRLDGPLHELMDKQPEAEFVGVMRDFRTHLDAMVLNECPHDRYIQALETKITHMCSIVEMCYDSGLPIDLESELRIAMENLRE